MTENDSREPSDARFDDLLAGFDAFRAHGGPAPRPEPEPFPEEFARTTQYPTDDASQDGYGLGPADHTAVYERSGLDESAEQGYASLAGSGGVEGTSSGSGAYYESAASYENAASYESAASYDSGASYRSGALYESGEAFDGSGSFDRSTSSSGAASADDSAVDLSRTTDLSRIGALPQFGPGAESAARSYPTGPYTSGAYEPMAFTGDSTIIQPAVGLSERYTAVPPPPPPGPTGAAPKGGRPPRRRGRQTWFLAAAGVAIVAGVCIGAYSVISNSASSAQGEPPVGATATAASSTDAKARTLLVLVDGVNADGFIATGRLDGSLVTFTVVYDARVHFGTADRPLTRAGVTPGRRVWIRGRLTGHNTFTASVVASAPDA